MDKKIQDLAWASLPKEARERLRRIYRTGLKKEWRYSAYLRGRLRLMREIYGEHNLISYTEPEEMLMVKREIVTEIYKYATEQSESNRYDSFAKGLYSVQTTLLKSLFGDKCLPDTTVAENATVAPKPKFKVGQPVRVLAERAFGRIERIETYDEDDNTYRLEYLPDFWFEPSVLELYTEEKEPMEEKELNLAELLKGCEGEFFYVIPCGEMELKGINKFELKPLHFSKDSIINCITKADGRAYENGSCIIYPSRALYEKYPLDPYSAWMEWKEARTPKRWIPKDGVKYWFINNLFNPESTIFDEEDPEDIARVEAGNCFTTQESCAQASEAVRETLEKFHSEHSDK